MRARTRRPRAARAPPVAAPRRCWVPRRGHLERSGLRSGARVDRRRGRPDGAARANARLVDGAEEGLDRRPELRDRRLAIARLGREGPASVGVEPLDEVGARRELRGEAPRTVASEARARPFRRRVTMRSGFSPSVYGNASAPRASRRASPRSEKSRSAADALVALLVLLGRRVTERRAGERRRALEAQVDELHEPEVRDLGRSRARLGREEDVRRLEVAVDDLLRVHALERVHHLAPDPPHALERRADAPRCVVETCSSVGPCDVLEDGERQRDGRPLRATAMRAVGVIEEANDVRVRPPPAPSMRRTSASRWKRRERLGVHRVGAQHLDDDDGSRRARPSSP